MTVTKTRVVMISAVLPHEGIPHAGGRYLADLVRLVDPATDLLVVVPNNPTTRAAKTRTGTPSRVVVPGATRSSTVLGRAGSRVAAVLDRSFRRVDPGLPSLPLALDLLRDPSLRRAIRAAEVIDLQWSESIRLLPVIRWLNPRARVVGTYHDVQSQLFSRESGTTRRGRLYWRVVSRRARTIERRHVRRLDRVLVFSDKDADLLGSPHNAMVARPPLALGLPPITREESREPIVVFVSHLARPENDDAARWLVGSIWPAVRAAHPNARLRLVGAGASPELTQLVADDPSITADGFVDDLATVYATAQVCVVPLRFGAGVKFKTVEALLHEVPVVATAVGAEGIGSPHHFAALSDDPTDLAAGLIDVLQSPNRSVGRSRDAARWARENYDWPSFTARISEAYGLALRASGDELG